MLLKHGAAPNVQSMLGSTALHCAAGYGAVPIVQALLDAGADASIRDQDGKTPADLARSYGQGACLELLGG